MLPRRRARARESVAVFGFVWPKVFALWTRDLFDFARKAVGRKVFAVNIYGAFCDGESRL